MTKKFLSLLKKNRENSLHHKVQNALISRKFWKKKWWKKWVRKFAYFPNMHCIGWNDNLHILTGKTVFTFQKLILSLVFYHIWKIPHKLESTDMINTFATRFDWSSPRTFQSWWQIFIYKSFNINFSWSGDAFISVSSKNALDSIFA